MSKTQVASNRAHILAVAARRFRERGVDGTGVADLMQEAGFTHGGFYNHFASKQALAAEAFAAAFDESLAELIDTLSGDPHASIAPLLSYLRQFLSRAHRDDLCGSCPTVSLATDAARQGIDVQTAFADGLQAMVGTLAEHVSATMGMRLQAATADPAAPTAAAMRMLSESVGALLLARAVGPANSTLSDAILDASRRGLTGTSASRTPPARPATAATTDHRRRRTDDAG